MKKFLIKRKKFISKNFLRSTIIPALLIFLCSNTSSASKLDSYRKMLMENSYTIIYDNITPAPRITNRDKVELYGKNGLSVESDELLINRPKSGIITCLGTDKYEEVGDDKLTLCRLAKSGEDFFFTKYKHDNQWEYVGTKKNRVVANEKNYLAEIIEGKSFGDADMTRLLNAIVPNAEKSAEQVEYKFVAEGNLEGDIFYEDYRADNGETTEVVRYYFSNNNLVKISSASYYRTPEGKIDGRRCIIKIRSFTAAPDTSLLKLPPTLKDVTKRKSDTEASSS